MTPGPNPRTAQSRLMVRAQPDSRLPLSQQVAGERSQGTSRIARYLDGQGRRLMMEVAGEDFESQPLPDRIILDDVEQVVRRHLIDVRTEEGF